ncbi:GTPase domain-containing protein [Methylomonas paludis]|uniref:GTPase domain-containing protein n=1 Tax=Methylomonas paludis TaxID=1173101 RepID=A0A975RAG3_9GAMM|nr:GTPase domain-containing protein [Methylomonas paludis]QWF72122.1 GTPase domain-containing protein [Methylomonas paludis]
MLEFIQLLKQRYQAVLLQLDKKNPLFLDYQQCVEQLLYAEAFIRKGQLISAYPKLPLQIAVIGPTQVGKSSVVNLLLNNDLAGVSPLAGYTVHPHGYYQGLSAADQQAIQHYFTGFTAISESSLSAAHYDRFSLTANPAGSKLLPQGLCWDTPDFDSIDAADYREGVIRTIALADVIVVVVSKEKYADQSVWEVLQTIAGFQQPTLICLNKLSPGSEAEVIKSLEQKWRQHRNEALPEIIPMLFHKPGGTPVWPAASAKALLKLAGKVAHAKQPRYQQQWLQQYWQQWLQPVYAEHQAQQRWQQLVDSAIKQAGLDYRRDYLDHPHHYETFQKAVLSMLNLLEIPGIAKAVSQARRTITWPLRQLMSLGKDSGKPPLSQEQTVLRQIGGHVMIHLADKLLEIHETTQAPSAWWQETTVLLRQHKQTILGQYDALVFDYQQHFEQDVEAAATRLYHKLQEQPLVLNSLRATRISTDVLVMLLAIQAGGIGVHDLLLTPMMLSITSYLAESAIGSYMDRVAADLKRHQFNTVHNGLFDSHLKQALYRLPQLSLSNNSFNIPESLCRQAEKSLNEKKHGLRLL